ncbi:MAG: hypothetical protein ACI9XK_003263 [Granulosicoccus sp.]|jgi:hypothetical protein
MSANAVLKFDAYRALAEMGITRFHEISHYSLRQDGKDKDVLRVNYKRAKGSLLPYSRKYNFGRSLKTVIADGGTARMETTYEISPFLLRAVSELEALVDSNQHSGNKPAKVADIKSDLLKEINELAQLIRESQCDDKAVVAKLVSVRKNVESL